MRGGGEAGFLALGWQKGHDPYCTYNGLDPSYRPLSYRHPCPTCFSVRHNPLAPCELCGWRGFVEIPLEEPGAPKPPPHPRRLRNFIYGMAQALDERANKSRGALG